MNIGLIAMSGVRVRTKELVALGVTLLVFGEESAPVKRKGRARLSAKVGQVCNLSRVSASERLEIRRWWRRSISRPLTWLLSPWPRQVANLSYLELRPRLPTRNLKTQTRNQLP